MSNVLPGIPHGVPIMVTAINDQPARGMLRSVKAAERYGNAGPAAAFVHHVMVTKANICNIIRSFR